MGLARMALRNPYSVIVMAMGVLIVGVTLLIRLPVDILPQFRTPAVQVLTTYTGMPTDLMEEDITNRLERWTSQATGIDHQTSRSLIGVSVIRNFFHDGTDPSNALTQVSALAMSDLHYLPPGTLPPIVQLFDPTASMPVALMSVTSDTLNETQLYDVGYYEIRTLLSGAAGTVVPAVFGGNLRRIMVYVNKDKLLARNLSLMDVVNALDAGNTMIPTGDANIGNYDYAVTSNAMVPTVDDLNRIPIKWENGKPVYIQDVGKAEDAFAIQTNVVRVDGRRCVYCPIYRQAGSNTIAVVEGVKKMIPELKYQVTNGTRLKLDVILDQSIYVREAIEGLEREGVMGFVLAAVGILLFLGSWRATGIVAITLPLSLLPAFILLYFSGQTLNVMTLGGLALSVGMIMDQAIIVLENIARHIEEGQAPWDAARDGAYEIANPVLVATLTICIVFAPVSLMTGVGKFLFTPLALAVVFAIGSSYVNSIMLVPVACRYFLTEHSPGHKSWFERGYERFQHGYERLLTLCMHHRPIAITVIGLIIVGCWSLFPLIGMELFPGVDSGQFMVMMRAPTGMRIEKTEDMVKLAEDEIHRVIAKDDLHMVVSNIGVPQNLLAGYTPNAGPSDAMILIQLSANHKVSPQEYAERLRVALPRAVPGAEFSYDTAGLIAAALNFGLLSPIDIQVTGPREANCMAIAQKIKDEVEKIPGAVDVRIQQRLDYPELALDIDRTRAAAMGVTIDGIVKNLVSALNSSAQFTNNFWVDSRNGNNYYIGATYRPKDINSFHTLNDVPIDAERYPINGMSRTIPVILRNVADITSTQTAFEADHLNLRRIIDVYANVSQRDVGGVSSDILTMLSRHSMPIAYHATLLGEYAAMRESFISLGFGLALAVILVYLAMVTQFRSFIDPFVVMFAVPPDFAGVLLMLWLTHTTINVQSLLGTIMVSGLTVSSSVLIVDFANHVMSQGHNAFEAGLQAGKVRLRPILMTAVAAIFGLLPTALHSGEANTPLARAVIGGLLVSTVCKVLLLPMLYSYWKKSPPAPPIED